MLCVSLPDFPKYDIYIDRRIVNKKTGRELKPWLNNHGYYQVRLCHNGKRKTLSIHRLLAMCFIPCNVDFKNITVDHINQNRTDNRLENLRWADNFVQHQNQGDVRTNTSGEKNISFDKTRNKWVFKIRRNGIVHRKRFDTKEEAIAYKLEWFKS
tara:strand:- start:162 stop:626 length:465 start_codon:yes stop_codon:yes gene_type:complete